MASDFNKFESSEPPSGNPFSAISRSLSDSVNEGAATRLSGMRTAISEALSTITPEQWEQGGALPHPIALPRRWVGAHTIASCSDDKTVRVWNAEDGRHLRTLGGHSTSVSGVAFSPDGRTIASCSSDTTVRVWNAEDGRHLRTLEGHSNSVNGVAFSPTASLSDEGQRSIGTLTQELRDAGFTAVVSPGELTVRWPAHPA